jgi:hypothetical protein
MKKFYVVFFVMICLFACRKTDTTSHPSKAPPQVSNSVPITVSFDENETGIVIPERFQGLSYETGILAESPEILNADNKVLVQLIKNLGPGILRIGGDSSDETFWTGHARKANTGKDSITTTDIDRLAGFSKAIGWPVMFGLNMGKNDAAVAANEVQYVDSKLGNSLYALQAGNEPDVYHLFGLRSPSYGPEDYKLEFESYLTAIRAVVPQVAFAGPGPAYNTDWIESLADSHHHKLKLLDAHYYVTGPASNPAITYQSILTPGFKLPNILSHIKNKALQHNLPYRITECNSIYGGGKAGVSDIFASSLWALDLMWSIAAENGEGINFHGGNHLIYSPVTIENGVITARPVYYAMLAFKNAARAGKMLTPTVSSVSNCSVYICAHSDNSRTVTLINKDETNGYYVTVRAGKSISSIQVARLTGPSITSTTGTTFSKSIVNADGTFVPGSPERYSVNNKSFSINIPAGSAAVITLL